jgi:hypothetical protein
MFLCLGAILKESQIQNISTNYIGYNSVCTPLHLRLRKDGASAPKHVGVI